MSEKNEQPTTKRLCDARQEGQVAKSQEINAVVLLGVILLWLVAEGPALHIALAGLIISTVDVINLPINSAIGQMGSQLSTLLYRFVFGLATLLVSALTFTGLIQSGFLFAPKALNPSGKRIGPLSNMKQIMSMCNVFEVCKMLLKVAVLGFTLLYLIKRYATSFAHLSHAGLDVGLAVCIQMALWMFSILLGVTAAFSIADYAMQHRQLRKQLMMSREEIKQEHKDSEGSQEVKQRRRELYHEVQSGSLAGNVAKSSVVVRNPTHLAVCLRYKAGETPLPQVLEIGRDASALQIVLLAEEHGVPVVENVPLARALVASSRPGDYIPESLFQAVAELLRIIKNVWHEKEEGDDADA
ncbi:type III secretion system protein [Burkholderia lata]|uniref:EscU/YscU/HrcU family type III secretion system export apparatus switch protein n=1 Tax=Burkholderia lata (strain ATCC 17760 / DSM 23089 / LMG 22485 / NCIMB 9086 / R18194 / 383) TaxID=482957 RepID=UPI00145494A9|nr:EscU/YscU/HrcU family type III secretion system export apparatus switch protein [Burkholderia lata]VWD64981.1 type III secretion system protein [Burkholderia lata]